MHCALNCKELSPRVGWCFSGETFMGVCRKLALKSNGCSNKMPRCNLLTMKYGVGMYLAMHDPKMFFFAIGK
jgi:hypothetical protein